MVIHTFPRIKLDTVCIEKTNRNYNKMCQNVRFEFGKPLIGIEVYLLKNKMMANCRQVLFKVVLSVVRAGRIFNIVIEIPLWQIYNKEFSTYEKKSCSARSQWKGPSYLLLRRIFVEKRDWTKMYYVHIEKLIKFFHCLVIPVDLQRYRKSICFVRWKNSSDNFHPGGNRQQEPS